MNIALTQEVPDMIVAADSLLPTFNPPSKAEQRPANVENDVQRQEEEESREQSIPTDEAGRERQTIKTPDPGPVFIQQPQKRRKPT